MWVGIVLVGVIMAVGPLLVLDARLPGGLIEGTGDMRYGQTMAFTTLSFFSLWLGELGKIVVPETASWRQRSRPRP
jgi:hypothetical protein